MHLTQSFIDFMTNPAFVCDGASILLHNEAFEKLMGKDSIKLSECGMLFREADQIRLRKAVAAVIAGEDQIELNDLTAVEMATTKSINVMIKAAISGNVRKALVILNSPELVLMLGQGSRARRNLINQEKLAGIGNLAAGVAHEIFNPLGYIKSNIDMLMEYFEDLMIILEAYKKAIYEQGESETLKAIKELSEKHDLDFILSDIGGLFSDVDEGIQRVLNIVSGLKRFAHESDEVIEYDMNEGIKSTLTLSKNEFKYDAKLSVEYGDIPKTYANGSKINQVILGIIVNAVFSIKKKYEGKLGNLKIRTFAENAFVCCSICDDGVGISKDSLEKIFEPFFTTKPEGVGTGLGLSIARDIIEGQHKGRLEVLSTYGEGACFTIKLPIAYAPFDSESEEIGQVSKMDSDKR